MRLAVVLGVLTVIAGVLPAAVAWVGQLIVDSVVAAIAVGGDPGSTGIVLKYVAFEAGIVILIAATPLLSSLNFRARKQANLPAPSASWLTVVVRFFNI